MIALYNAYKSQENFLWFHARHGKAHATHYIPYLNALPQERSTLENHENHLACQIIRKQNF